MPWTDEGERKLAAARSHLTGLEAEVNQLRAENEMLRRFMSPADFQQFCRAREVSAGSATPTGGDDDA